MIEKSNWIEEERSSCLIEKLVQWSTASLSTLSLIKSPLFMSVCIFQRQDYLFRELLALELHLPNVRLSRRRHATIWGGASLLTMLLESMSELVNSAWDWDFVINLSESDFPVKWVSLTSFLTIFSSVCLYFLLPVYQCCHFKYCIFNGSNYVLIYYACMLSCS